MKTTIKRAINSSIFILFLAATIIFGCRCTTSRTTPDPLAGWKGGSSAYVVGNPFDKTITDDYQKYVQTLPPEEKSRVDDFSLRFYEGEAGQRAVEIAIPIKGTWWKHVLIYDKDNKRTRTIKYAAGRYQS